MLCVFFSLCCCCHLFVHYDCSCHLLKRAFLWIVLFILEKKCKMNRQPHWCMLEHAFQNKFKLKIITHNALLVSRQIQCTTHSFMGFCSILLGVCMSAPQKKKNCEHNLYSYEICFSEFLYRSTQRVEK